MRYMDVQDMFIYCTNENKTVAHRNIAESSSEKYIHVKYNKKLKYK